MYILVLVLLIRILLLLKVLLHFLLLFQLLLVLLLPILFLFLSPIQHITQDFLIMLLFQVIVWLHLLVLNMMETKVSY